MKSLQSRLQFYLQIHSQNQIQTQDIISIGFLLIISQTETNRKSQTLPICLRQHKLTSPVQALKPTIQKVPKRCYWLIKRGFLGAFHFPFKYGTAPPPLYNTGE